MTLQIFLKEEIGGNSWSVQYTLFPSATPAGLFRDARELSFQPGFCLGASFMFTFTLHNKMVSAETEKSAGK